MVELDRIDLPPGDCARPADAPRAFPRPGARRARRALALVAPVRRTELYWTARSVFVSSQAQPTFDRVFAAVFDPALEPDEERGTVLPDAQRLSAERAPSDRPAVRAEGTVPSGAACGGPIRARRERRGARGRGPLALASEEERLRKKRFQRRRAPGSSVADDGVELAVPRRRSRGDVGRETRRAPRPAPDPAREPRTGGDPMTLAGPPAAPASRGAALRHLGLDGAVRPRLSASPDLGGCQRRLAEAFVFDSPDASHARSAGVIPRRRSDGRPSLRTGRAAPESERRCRASTTVRAPRHGSRRRRRDPLGRDGSAPIPRWSAARWSARLAHRIVWVNPRAAAPGSRRRRRDGGPAPLRRPGQRRLPRRPR